MQRISNTTTIGNTATIGTFTLIKLILIILEHTYWNIVNKVIYSQSKLDALEPKL